MAEDELLKNKLIIYAPNIHVGGGLVLLEGLIDEVATRRGDVLLILDARIRGRRYTWEPFNVRWVKRGIFSRMLIEFNLYVIGQKNYKILCLHSIPPIFRTKAKLIIFIQNRLLISYEQNTLSLKRMVASYLIRAYCDRVSQFIVQTESMKCELHKVLIKTKKNFASKIKVCPYVEFKTKGNLDNSNIEGEYFIYIADGWEHKNHINLIKAWKILLDYGVKPRLLITVPARHIKLLNYLEKFIEESPIRIENIGSINRGELFQILSRARALIYPSTTESFGLPLLEASHLEVPIIAAEKDYVRDVCSPVETFDPSSPLSIARAIMRHLGVEVQLCQPVSAGEFMGIVECVN